LQSAKPVGKRRIQHDCIDNDVPQSVNKHRARHYCLGKPVQTAQKPAKELAKRLNNDKIL